MRPLAGETLRAFERLVAPLATTADDRRKRTYVCLCLVFLIPIIVGFGVEDLRRGELTEGALVMVMAVFLAGILIALNRARDLAPIFRLGIAAALLLQLYELKIGGGGGYALFWFYCLPILAMTVFGRREGTAWVLAALISAALGFIAPWGHEYELTNVLRFLIVYLLLAIFSYALESSRDRFYSELLEEKVSLEDALARIKTLRGLLPICSQCKKVRDDQGYWQQLECFVDEHSEAEFSHGVCPKCAIRFHPELRMRSH